MVLGFIISLDPKPFLKFGYVGIFVFNLFGPGTILIPTLARHMNVVAVSVVGAVAMGLNDSVSWVIGKSGDIVIPRSKKVERLEKRIHKYGPWSFFFLSMIPIPYDLIGFVAGYLEFNYKAFVIPTILGRMLRFILLGSGVVWFFGKAI